MLAKCNSSVKEYHIRPEAPPVTTAVLPLILDVSIDPLQSTGPVDLYKPKDPIALSDIVAWYVSLLIDCGFLCRRSFQ